MELSAADLQSLWLTARLATVVTALLLILGTPVAYWLAKTDSMWRGPVSALVAMPLILPPTVIGFYLLLAMGPKGTVGWLTETLGLGILPFTFWGLVVASVIYSMPFVIQPIRNAIESLGDRPLEVAATLGAGPWDRFFTVLLPMTKSGFLTAAILGFAHTVGEFGVVLMIGGSIPGETQVASIQIYEHVESLSYANAHSLSVVLLVFSFLVLVGVYGLNQKRLQLPSGT